MIDALAFLDILGIVSEVHGYGKALLEYSQVVLCGVGDLNPAPRLPLIDLSKSVLAFPITDHNLAFIWFYYAKLLYFSYHPTSWDKKNAEGAVQVPQPSKLIQ
jgi:hypothetical protein